MKTHIYVTTRKTCSQALREAFVKEYDPESPYFDFAFYLLTATWRDPNTDCVVLKKEVLQHFAYDAETRRTGSLFLERFRKEYMPEFEYTDFSRRGGMARLGYVEFSEEIRRAHEQDLDVLKAGEPRVFVKSGEPFTRKEMVRLYHEEMAAFNGVVHLMPSPEAEFIAEYMNSVPLKLFEKLRDNIPHAAHVAGEIDNDHSRKQNLEMLAKIYEQPKPFYLPSPHGATDRLFGKGSAFVNLKSEVRHAITQGMWECDLRASQLAIIAKLWNIPKLEEAIRSTEDVWALFGTKEDKPLVKECLYSVVYGRGLEELEQLAPVGFLDNDLVKLILSCRSIKQREVERKGFAYTCSGRKLEVQQVKGWRTNVLSIIAQQAQAIEMSLLIPAVRLAQLRGLALLGWQHDGFTIDFPHDGVANVWLPRMRLVVEEKAASLGVHTGLVYKKL